MEEDTLLNDAFDLLSKANELEEQYDREGKKEDSLLIQASSTYFEAVFLFKRYLNRLPFEPSSPRSSEASRTRKLLKEKIRHYEGVAADLLGHLGSGCDQSPQRKSLHVHVDTPTHCSNSSASAAPFQSDDIAEKVSLANNLFATALDRDEKSRYDDASESYLKACESYLEAIKISEESSKKNGDAVKVGPIKRKLEVIMDRIEQLKAGQQNNSFTKSFTNERE